MAIRLQDILLITSTPNSRHTFLGEEVSESLSFNEHTFKCEWLIFQNVRFRNQIYFSNLSIGIGIKFINCIFEGTITFNNLTTKSNLDLLFDSEGRNLIFIGCTCERKIEIIGSNSLFENEITFSKCSFLEDVILEDFSVKKNGIKIELCTIELNFKIQKILLNDRFHLIDSVVKGLFDVINIHCNIFEIIGNTFNDFISIRENIFDTVLSCNENVFEREVYLRNNESTGTLLITGGQFKNLIRISYFDREQVKSKGFDKIQISDATFLNGLFVSGKNSFYPEPKYTRMHMLSINCSSILQGDIHFEDFDICEFTLTGFNTKANLVFNRLLVNNLSIIDFFNYAQLVFSEVKSSDTTWYYSTSQQYPIKSMLSITQANLGKTHLFQADLDSFDVVEINDAIFSDIITSNVIWFKHEKIKIKNEELDLSKNSAVDREK